MKDDESRCCDNGDGATLSDHLAKAEAHECCHAHELGGEG